MSNFFITGGSGFIGSRLVELVLENHIVNSSIRVLCRDLSKAVRLSRFPVNFVYGSMTDKNLLKESIKPNDVVIHCAHDFSSPENNIVAAKALAEICAEARVKRLIYLSSFAVHDTRSLKTIDENTPLNNSWDYALNKMEIENIFKSSFQNKKLPVVILRPTIVYGPFSGSWTIAPYMDMRYNRKALPLDGKGICNPLYIDDLCQVILNAVQADEHCLGESYLISGSESLTWADFFQPINNLLGNDKLFLFNDNSKETTTSTGTKPKAFDPLNSLKNSVFYSLYKKLLKFESISQLLLKAKHKFPLPILWPKEHEYITYTNQAKVDISKAIRDLNFNPVHSFSEGSKKAVSFLQWYFND